MTSENQLEGIKIYGFPVSFELPYRLTPNTEATEIFKYFWNKTSLFCANSRNESEIDSSSGTTWLMKKQKQMELEGKFAGRFLFRKLHAVSTS